MGIKEQLLEINTKYQERCDKHPLLDFDDVATALKDIRDQYLAGKPLVWNGPNKLHPSISATNMDPAWHFSQEGLAYNEDHGRDFWDIYTLIAFHLGFHNGTVYQSYKTFEYERLLDLHDLKA